MVVNPPNHPPQTMGLPVDAQTRMHGQFLVHWVTNRRWDWKPPTFYHFSKLKLPTLAPHPPFSLLLQTIAQKFMDLSIHMLMSMCIYFKVHWVRNRRWDWNPPTFYHFSELNHPLSPLTLLFLFFFKPLSKHSWTYQCTCPWACVFILKSIGLQIEGEIGPPHILSFFRIKPPTLAPHPPFFSSFSNHCPKIHGPINTHAHEHVYSF